MRIPDAGIDRGAGHGRGRLSDLVPMGKPRTGSAVSGGACQFQRHAGACIPMWLSECCPNDSTEKYGEVSTKKFWCLMQKSQSLKSFLIFWVICLTSEA